MIFSAAKKVCQMVAFLNRFAAVHGSWTQAYASRSQTSKQRHCCDCHQPFGDHWNRFCELSQRRSLLLKRSFNGAKMYLLLEKCSGQEAVPVQGVIPVPYSGMNRGRVLLPSGRVVTGTRRPTAFSLNRLPVASYKPSPSMKRIKNLFLLIKTKPAWDVTQLPAVQT